MATRKEPKALIEFTPEDREAINHIDGEELDMLCDPPGLPYDRQRFKALEAEKRLIVEKYSLDEQ